MTSRFGLLALALAACAPGVSAQEAGAGMQGVGMRVDRQVVAGGGGTSTGGAFRVDGTLGQADADPLHPATGGVFAVSGGFWAGLSPAPPAGELVFANGFEPPSP